MNRIWIDVLSMYEVLKSAPPFSTFVQQSASNKTFLPSFSPFDSLLNQSGQNRYIYFFTSYLQWSIFLFSLVLFCIEYFIHLWYQVIQQHTKRNEAKNENTYFHLMLLQRNMIDMKQANPGLELQRFCVLIHNSLCKWL